MQSRPPLRRLIQLAIVVIADVFLSVPASAEILKVTLNDTIQPISEEYIARAIAEAGHRNDQAILIEINTPGGLVESTPLIRAHYGLCGPSHHLRYAQWKPRGICGLFHP